MLTGIQAIIASIILAAEQDLPLAVSAYQAIKNLLGTTDLATLEAGLKASGAQLDADTAKLDADVAAMPG